MLALRQLLSMLEYGQFCSQGGISVRTYAHIFLGIIFIFLMGCNTPRYGYQGNYARGPRGTIQVVVQSMRPGDGRMYVSPDAEITFTLSVPVALIPDSFQVYKMTRNGKQPIYGSLYPSDNYQTYRFVPHGRLERGEWYTCQLLGFVDAQGNVLHAKSWAFRTESLFQKWFG